MSDGSIRKSFLLYWVSILVFWVVYFVFLSRIIGKEKDIVLLLGKVSLFLNK